MKKYHTKTERNQQIRSLWEAGRTFAEIGTLFGVTRQRVHQICSPRAQQLRTAVETGRYHRNHPDASYYRPKTPTPLRALITSLGGTGVVARAVGVVPSSVSNWMAHGAIPPKWYLPLREIAVTHGIHLDPKLFRELNRDNLTGAIGDSSNSC